MDCETYRQRLGEDPADTAAELNAHAEACPACAAYAGRLHQAEALIQRALRFDVSAAATATRTSETALAAAASGGALWSGLVAAGVILVALAVTVSNRPATTEDLVNGIVAHWDHEPDSWAVSDVAVSNAVLQSALGGSANLDLTALGIVSFAKSCRIAGQWLPHIVVQSESGPVMVLLVPNRPMDVPVPIEIPDAGLGGNLRPFGNGSIAVIGKREALLLPIELQVQDAVDWSI